MKTTWPRFDSTANPFNSRSGIPRRYHYYSTCSSTDAYSFNPAAKKNTRYVELNSNPVFAGAHRDWSRHTATPAFVVREIARDPNCVRDRRSRLARERDSKGQHRSALHPLCGQWLTLFAFVLPLFSMTCLLTRHRHGPPACPNDLCTHPLLLTLVRPVPCAPRPRKILRPISTAPCETNPRTAPGLTSKH